MAGVKLSTLKRQTWSVRSLYGGSEDVRSAGRVELSAGGGMAWRCPGDFNLEGLETFHGSAPFCRHNPFTPSQTCPCNSGLR